MDLILIGIGIILVLFCIKKVYAKIWSKGIEVNLSFSKTEAYPGEEVTLTEVISNHKWLPLPMLIVKFAIDRSLEFLEIDQDVNVSDQCYKSEIFSLMFYQRITRKLPFVCRKRGYFTIQSINLVSTDLFMNRVLATVLPIDQSITVYPKQIPFEEGNILFNRVMGTLLTKRYHYEDIFEFRGIREYQNYDTMRNINWNASARSGELKVNVHNYTASQEVLLLLNLEDEGIWKYDQLKEESISITASLALRLTEQGIGVSIISNGLEKHTKLPLSIDNGSDESHRIAILNALSRIELNQSMQDFALFIREHEEKIEHSSMIIMISTCKKVGLQEEYNRIVPDINKGMWIFPVHPDMDNKFTKVDQSHIYRWEVIEQ